MADEENAIFRGDNTAAFGNNFITITVKNPQLQEISKLVFSVNGGQITRTFTDETYFKAENITLQVNFDSEETAKLNNVNTGNLIAYDMLNRQCTCSQSMTFTAKNGVICKNARPCC